MRTKIYQINSDRDSKRIKFFGKDDMEKLTGSKEVDASLYDKVLDADIDEVDMEAVFHRFNTEGHPLHRGHSLSVSDVVVNDNGAYFCDSVGFSKIDFDESKTQIPVDTYRIVYVEPNKPAYATEIGSDYNALSNAVKGMIEVIHDTDDDLCYVGNEEAKLIGMEGNRHLSNGVSIIAGPFLVIGDDGEDFRSLTDEEIEEYVNKFAEPETITQEEVQNDTGFRIIGFEPNM